MYTKQALVFDIGNNQFILYFGFVNGQVEALSL